MDNLYTKDVDLLFDAILSLETREECNKFFKDALTSKEIIEIAQRLKAAKMLSSGSIKNQAISAPTARISAMVSTMIRLEIVFFFIISTSFILPGIYKSILSRVFL